MARIFCGTCGYQMRVAENGVWVRDGVGVRQGDLYQCLRDMVTVVAELASEAITPEGNPEIYRKVAKAFIDHADGCTPPAHVTGEMILHSLGWTKPDELPGEGPDEEVCQTCFYEDVCDRTRCEGGD